MFKDRTVVSRVLCLLSLATLAGCFGKPIKIKGSDAAVAGQQSDARAASGEAGPGDGPSPVADGKTAADGPSSNGGAGGNSGTGDSSAGGSTNDAIGPDAVVDAVADLPATADASGGMDSLSATGGAGGTGGTSGTGGVIGTDGGPGAVDVRPEAGDAPGADTPPDSPVGGSGGMGGTTTSGGMTATGGTTNTGGALATGGTTNMGGAPTTGGTTGSGGTTGPVLKTAGASCGATGECQTGLTCLDGVCCTQSTCPACQNCGATGTCSIVVSSADDTTGTTCTGTNTCGDTGACKKKSGETCLAAGDCASGKCVDSLDGTSKICCASTCSTCQGCKSDGSVCTGKKAGAPDSACGTAATCRTGNCNSAGTCELAGAGAGCGTNLYCTASAQCAPKLFEGLGVLPPQWGDASYANAVSADGTIVVGEVDGGAGEVSNAFKWTSATGMIALANSPGAGDTFATAISAGGIVGTGLQSPVAILWTTSLEYDLNNQDANGSRAYGISNNGTVVGVAINADNAPYRAVRWADSSSTPTTLDTSGIYPYSNATAISSDGTTIVGGTSSGAFKWTLSSGMVLLSGGASTTANATSSNGAVIVGSLNPISGSAVLWSGSTPTPLGAGVGEAFAVSSDGSVIVGTASGDAFIWDATNEQRSLSTVLTAAGADLTGWNLNQAKGISAKGKVIVGWGSHNGNDEGWIARLP